MIVGLVAFTMLDYLTPGPFNSLIESLDIIAMLGMFNNVLPNPDRIIWPGPFWFFGLMMQLYIIYRLFIYRRHWAFTVVLMVVCLALRLCLSPDGEAMNRYRLCVSIPSSQGGFDWDFVDQALVIHEAYEHQGRSHEQ